MKALILILLFAVSALSQGYGPGPGLANQATGGGGDPISYVGVEYASGFPDDTSPVTTSAFTPNGGTQLLVIAFLLGPADEGDWSSTLAISDSQTLTWTPLANDFVTGTSYGGATGWRAWLSSNTAASSMTVEVSSSSGQWRTSVVVAELENASTTITGLTADDTAPLTGGYTATLGAAPTADDASIFLRFGNNDASSSYSMTGWTTIADLTSPGEIIAFVAIRTGSTSTSATLSSVRSLASHGMDAVFNIQAQ